MPIPEEKSKEKGSPSCRIERENIRRTDRGGGKNDKRRVEGGCRCSCLGMEQTACMKILGGRFAYACKGGGAQQKGESRPFWEVDKWGGMRIVFKRQSHCGGGGYR